MYMAKGVENPLSLGIWIAFFPDSKCHLRMYFQGWDPLCIHPVSAMGAAHIKPRLCNCNLPRFGQADTPLNRILLPDYADGVSAPRVRLTLKPTFLSPSQVNHSTEGIFSFWRFGSMNEAFLFTVFACFNLWKQLQKFKAGFHNYSATQNRNSPHGKI